MSVATAIQSATRKINSMISGGPSDPEILDTLKQEHVEVSELLRKLVASESGAARRSLLAKVKAALLPHVQAEQTVLYDALIAAGDKKIQQDGQEGYIEHALAAAILSKLEATKNAMSAEFGAASKVLKELVEHHVREEESNVWSDARATFSAEERMLMNEKYLAAKKLADVPKKATPAPQKREAAGKGESKPRAAKSPGKRKVAVKSGTAAAEQAPT